MLNTFEPPKVPEGATLSSSDASDWEAPYRINHTIAFPQDGIWITQNVKKWIIYLQQAISQQGYAFYPRGGFILDSLLGLKPNDIDCVTNCPFEILSDLAGAYLNKTPRKDAYKIGDLIDIFYIEAKNDNLLLTASTEFNDVSVNGLGLDKNFNILDPCNFFNHLYSEELTLIGDSEETFPNDVAKILRIIRISSKIGKCIKCRDQSSIKKYACLLTDPQDGLPLGAYLKHFQALFLRGQANRNFFKLHNLNALGYLLPFFKEPVKAPRILKKFWYIALKEIDNTEPTERRNRYSSYHPMALLLLLTVFPLKRQWIYPEPKRITKAINTFCRSYPNSSDYHVRLQENLFPILQNYSIQFFEHFQEYRYLAALEQDSVFLNIHSQPLLSLNLITDMLSRVEISPNEPSLFMPLPPGFHFGYSPLNRPIPQNQRGVNRKPYKKPFSGKR